MKVRHVVIIFIAFLALGFFIYRNTLTTEFLSDDWHWLSVASARSSILPDVFANYAGEKTGGSYNPVASLYINTLFYFFGLNPVPYHVASVVLHSVVATLVAALVALWIGLVPTDKRAHTPLLFSILLGGVYLVFPSHVETVVWLASAPHILATLFYVATLLLYFLWKKNDDIRAYVCAVLCCTLALLSKESAVSLPIVLICMDVAFERSAHQRWFSSHSAGLFLFAGLVAGFLYLRYIATGLLIGTYAENALLVRIPLWANTVGTFFEEFITAGYGRFLWMRLFWKNPGLLSTAVCSAVIASSFFVFRRGFWIMRGSWMMLLAATVPFIPLGFNRTTSDGERYVYLPLVLWMLFFASVLTLLKQKKIVNVLLLIVIFTASWGTHIKTRSWTTAGLAAHEIVSGLHLLTDSNPRVVSWYVVGLPDTISGAHVFRNNLKEALRLRTGISQSIHVVPVYLNLETETYAERTMTWSNDNRGFTARSVDGAYRVTGVDRRELPYLTFELWGYRYPFFTSNTIRLILGQDVLMSLQDGTGAFVTWDRGRMMMLPYSG